MTTAVIDELFLLPCDHRSILRQLHLSTHDESAASADWITEAKETVLDGLLDAEALGVARSSMGLLIDEEYGAGVARRARQHGVAVFMPVDHGELGPFELQYGDRFVEHIERQQPDFVTALVEYAPASRDRHSQLRRLETLLAWLERSAYPFLLELQVPPTDEQLDGVGGDMRAWAGAGRPGEIAQAIRELKAAGARPVVWKIEACATEEQYRGVTEAMRADGAQDAIMVVLGAGADEPEVSSWLRVAAKVPACRGFAIGRTVWLAALTRFAGGDVDRRGAADEIARAYSHFCTVFRAARTATVDPA